jgi:hypothetical protein
LASADDEQAEPSALRDLLNSLEALEPEPGRQLARFAYMLGRVALADRRASEEETLTMERLVAEEGDLTADQAAVVVGLAKNSNRLFGARPTSRWRGTSRKRRRTTRSWRSPVACSRWPAPTTRSHCRKRQSCTGFLNQLKILPQDLRALRARHARLLPGMSPAPRRS